MLWYVMNGSVGGESLEIHNYGFLC